MNQITAFVKRKKYECSTPMAMATRPPNQVNDAEYAELPKRKLFSILTILKRMHLKNFFATFFRPRKNLPKTAAKLGILVHVVTLTIMFYELELLMQMKDILWLKT